MPDDKFPTMEEFWKRLDVRDAEPDLKATLRQRAQTNDGPVSRVGKQETVVAFIERLLPGSDVPAAAMAAFVDEHFDEPMGRADERHGTMPRHELFPAGFRVLDEAARGSFAGAAAEEQDAILDQAEHGNLQGPDGFDSAIWFQRMRDLVLLGFGSDPRGMVQMGYPGPAYKPGHVWLYTSGVDARLARKPGYLEL